MERFIKRMAVIIYIILDFLSPSVYRYYDDFHTPSFRAEARMLCEKDGKRDSGTEWRICYSGNILPVFLTTVIDPSLPLVLLLSKSSKSLDHMLRKEYTVYCFEILWIGHMLRYHTDGFPESSTTVSQDDDWRFLSLWCLTFSIIVMLNVYRHYAY